MTYLFPLKRNQRFQAHPPEPVIVCRKLEPMVEPNGEVLNLLLKTRGIGPDLPLGLLNGDIHPLTHIQKGSILYLHHKSLPFIPSAALLFRCHRHLIVSDSQNGLLKGDDRWRTRGIGDTRVVEEAVAFAFYCFPSQSSSATVSGSFGTPTTTKIASLCSPLG